MEAAALKQILEYEEGTSFIPKLYHTLDYQKIACLNELNKASRNPITDSIRKFIDSMDRFIGSMEDKKILTDLATIEGGLDASIVNLEKKLNSLRSVAKHNQNIFGKVALAKGDFDKIADDLGTLKGEVTEKALALIAHCEAMFVKN